MKIRSFFRVSTFVLVFIGIRFCACADVTVHGLFSDNAVLQRGVAAPVWGWSADGEEISVTFANHSIHTKGKDGKWMVRLPALKAGGPHTLTVKGKNEVTFTNVYVGEVWVASGQSNMEWPMNLSHNPEKEILGSTQPLVHLYTVPKLKADEPRDNVPAKWLPCNPTTTSNFSAVAYYFARDLAKALNVHVGIIHTSWGGSPAEVWMSEQVLNDNPAYKKSIMDAYPEQRKRYDEAVAKWEKEKAEVEREGKKFDKRRPSAPWKPTELYNGMIAPLIPYAIKGAIWYQGESNAGRAWEYRTLFADMISNWREDWKQGDFPFLLVQLAPFRAIKTEPAESDWAELREAQYLATKKLRKVGMAVITDVGDPKDIHPKKKEPVGARLALAARAIAYGQKLTYSGPVYTSMKVQGSNAVLSFEHVGKGLEARPVDESVAPKGTTMDNRGASGLLFAKSAREGSNSSPELHGFSICGEDRKFLWGNARIEKNKVVVNHPAIAKPVAVRYGWADFPVVNLWNKDGLPASPFRTDNFPLTTQPKENVPKK